MDSQDFVTMYMQDVNSYFEQNNEKNELLSTNELIKLQKEYFNGSKKAREKIIMCNQKLVGKIARKYSSDSEQYLVNVQNGNLGLMKAIEYFDASAGYAFSTYASHWIECFINRKRFDYKPIRIPVQMMLINKKIDKFVELYYLNNGKKPTKEEIMDSLKLTDYNIESYYDKQYVVGSLNDVVNEDSHNKSEFIDSLKSENDNILDKENEIFNDELRQTIFDVMNYRLNEQERIILTKIFNLNGEGYKTLMEIGAELGVTYQRVGYVKKVALKKLEKHNKLKSYAKTL